MLAPPIHYTQRPSARAWSGFPPGIGAGITNAPRGEDAAADPGAVLAGWSAVADVFTVAGDGRWG